MGCGCFLPGPLEYYSDFDNDGFGYGEPQAFCSDPGDGWSSNNIDPEPFCYNNDISSLNIDDCGICNGNNQDLDCSGVCFGSAGFDDCGVCDGDNSSCQSPVADNLSFLSNEDEILLVILSGSDPNNEDLSFIITDSPSHGVLVGDPDNSSNYNYIPNENYYGSDSFTYIASNGEFYSDEALVSIQIDSVKSQGEIAKRTKLPVANGERMHSIWEFRELFEAGGSQYVRPDLGLGGGVTGVKKIAGLAESYHSALVTHNFLGPVLTAAACNIDTSIPNFLTQEYSMEDEQPFNAIFNSSWKRDGGFIPVPDTPGIGIDLEVESLKSQPYKPRDLQVIPMRTDGSVGYSV